MREKKSFKVALIVFPIILIASLSIIGVYFFTKIEIHQIETIFRYGDIDGWICHHNQTVTDYQEFEEKYVLAGFDVDHYVDIEEYILRTYYTFFRFNISDIGNANSAIITLYIKDISWSILREYDVPLELEVHYVNELWNKSTISYNNMPNFNSTILSLIKIVRYEPYNMHNMSINVNGNIRYFTDAYNVNVSIELDISDHIGGDFASICIIPRAINLNMSRAYDRHISIYSRLTDFSQFHPQLKIF